MTCAKFEWGTIKEIVFEKKFWPAKKFVGILQQPPASCPTKNYFKNL
jgi:hypothetical protein